MIVLAMLLMTTAVEPAATSGQVATPPPAAAKVNNDSEIVCRREAEPNSIIRTKVCKTNAEWRQRQKEDPQTVQDMQHQGLRATSSSSGAP